MTIRVTKYLGTAMVALLALAVLTVALAACENGGSERRLNIVEEAGLADAGAMTIKRRLPEDTRGMDQADELRLLAIVTAEQLKEMLLVLDQPLPLKTGIECESQFIVDFKVGSLSNRMSYRCGDADLFLWGNQGYWRGRVLIVPPAFEELLQEAIAPR